jgi:UDP-glucose 4-epimerase
VKDPTGDFNASIPVTFNLLSGLRLHTPACRLIYLSSAAVYGNAKALPIDETEPAAPISPYGFHKLVCEHLCTEFCKVYGLPTTIVRIFSAYGAGLRRQVLWDICRKALTGEALRLRGTGNESRDFIHVQDVARAIHLVSEKGCYEGEVYNIASGTETTIKELADLILTQIGQAGRVTFDNRTAVGNPLNWRADISRLIRIGFVPQVSLEEGVRTFVSWCRGELAKLG